MKATLAFIYGMGERLETRVTYLDELQAGLDYRIGVNSQSSEGSHVRSTQVLRAL